MDTRTDREIGIDTRATARLERAKICGRLAGAHSGGIVCGARLRAALL